MKEFFVYNMDESSSHPLKQTDPLTPTWPFRMLVAGGSGSGKTNHVVNLLMGDKLKRLYYKQKGGRRYIPSDDIVLIGKHLNEPKWEHVRQFYEYLSEDPQDPCYEDVTFTAMGPEDMPKVNDF